MHPVATCCAALAMAATVLSAGAVDVGPPLKFAPGTPKLKARLQAIPALRELIAESFAAALVDLNDDGNNELVVISRSDAFCGSGGCMTVVVEVKGGRARVLLQQNLDPSMAVTRESFGSYHALAAVDATGAVQIANKPGTPLHGKPMVYPMLGASAVDAGPSVQPIEAKPATAPEASKSSPPGAVASSGPSILGVRPGMTQAEAEGLLRQRAAGCGKAAGVSLREPGTVGFYPAVLQLEWRGCDKGRSGFDGVRQENLQVLLSTPPDARVLAVVRHSTLEQPVPVDSLFEGLSRQYGAQADVRRHLWFFDAEGRPKPGLDEARCGEALRGMNPVDEYKRLVSAHRYNLERQAKTPLPTTIDASCGQVLILRAEPGQTTYSIEAALIDQTTAAAAAKDAARYLIEAARRREERALDGARKSPVPRL